MNSKFLNFRLLVCTLICSSSFSANASQERLEDFFSNVSTLTADFSQRVVDETGMLLELTSGRLSLSRPGKFRWDYVGEDSQLADRGVQIIADGESILLYDPDLEQVTQRSLQNALGQVPSLLLVQTGANIDDHFLITDIGITDSLSWVLLKPRAEDAGFQSIMIGFFQNYLAKITLIDGLGNETRLVLSNVANNPVMHDKVFHLDVPLGTDFLKE